MRKPPHRIRVGKELVCLFFACFLALGLATAGDYGQPFDELAEMDILRMNGWEYARAFGLDESAFEAWARLPREYQSPLTPISESAERDHGVSALYPLLSVVLDRDMDDSARQVIWHMYCWALFTLGAFALYACCRQLGLARPFGVLGAAMLLLSPRFFAEGHYNNKDVVLMALVLCALWQALRLMKKPTFGGAACFALFGALAANTKLAGLALWGLCALFVLAWHISHKSLTRRVAGMGLTALAGFAALYALLTPALWRAPAEFLTYLLQNAMAFTRWENYVRFRGATFDTQVAPLPWYYLPYMMLATTPLWTLALVGYGQARALVSIGQRREQALPLALVTLMWLLPLGFAVATRTTVYNGWRHFYFLYGPMLVLAAYGYSRLWRRLRYARARWARGAFAALLAACLLVTGAGLALNHPYQYAYYQPAERLAQPQDANELDYWNVSVQNALRTLAEDASGKLAVGYGDLWARLGLEGGARALPEALRERIVVTHDLAEARYVLVNPTYALFSGYEPSPGMEETVTIRAYGRVIMRIYERTVAP